MLSGGVESWAEELGHILSFWGGKKIQKYMGRENIFCYLCKACTVKTEDVHEIINKIVGMKG